MTTGEFWGESVRPFTSWVGSKALGPHFDPFAAVRELMASPASRLTATMSPAHVRPYGDLVASMMAPTQMSLPVARELLPPSLHAERAILSVMPHFGSSVLGPSVMGQFNTLVPFELPDLRVVAVGALGAAVREAGVLDEVLEASSQVPELSDVAAAASADAAHDGFISPRDVAIGVQATYWILALWLTVWINTGDDAARHGVRLLLEWVGTAGSVGAGGALVQRATRGGRGQSGG